MGEFSEIWDMLRGFAASSEVQFWGTWIALGGVIAVSVKLGLPHYREASEELQKVGEIRDPDGRIKLWPTKIKRMKKSFTALGRSARSAFLALIPIVGVPLAILVLVTVMSDWFFGGQQVVTTGPLQPGSSQYVAELSLYFADQLSRGIFFDAFEVFDIQLTDISAVRENGPYLWMLFGFRVIVDLYVVGLVTLLVRALWGVAINSLRLVNPF